MLQREYENACLLKNELNNRGYSVKICNIQFVDRWKSFFYRPKVWIVPGLYGGMVPQFIANRKSYKTKIVNLQYEQILDKLPSGTYEQLPQHDDKLAVHLCWGQKGYDQILSAGVREDHIKIVGSMQFDLLRPEFESYFLSKKDVAEKYNLDVNTKWILFISDFFAVEDVEEWRTSATDLKIKDVVKFNYNKDLFKQTLSWFDKFLSGHSDYTIIYRPHPSIVDDRNVSLLEKKRKHFRCIRDLSVNQWIKVSDVVTTCKSTSIIEAYSLKKPVLLLDLSPRDIDEKGYEKSTFRYPFFNWDKKIFNYKKFEKSCIDAAENNISVPEVINKEVFEQYYDIDKVKPSFARVADVCEEVLKDESFYEVYNTEGRKRSDLFDVMLMTLRNDIRIPLYPFLHRIFPKKKIVSNYAMPFNKKNLTSIMNNISKVYLCYKSKSSRITLNGESSSD